MTAKSPLEIEGNFLTHPFAELLVEIGAARLTGSLRASDKERKCVIYFKSGRVVFAASNAREARLFARLLSTGRLAKDDLAKIPNFQNDFELTGFLLDTGFLSETDRDRLFSEQVASIITHVLTWPEGAWTFSSLARVKDGLEFEIETRPLLLEYGRSMSVQKVLDRFRSMDESFGPVPNVANTKLDLRPEEGFILSRADSGSLSATDIAKVSAMPEKTALSLIYTLWLAGLLTRHAWQPALSEEAISLMKTAKLELKKEARVHGVTLGETVEQVVPEIVAVEEEKEEKEEKEKPLTVDEYLQRVESAPTYYDVLGIDTKATIPEIKQAYFALAKMFHPDRYHAEGGELLQRVQHAFTELASAHETLKSNDTRDLYDYRMRKELANRNKSESEKNDASGRHAEEAADHFEHGFKLLDEKKPEEALPFLARAANYSPKTAKYRAYYGKALSADSEQRHRAESEMQAAVKLDPENATYRLLLAEFFIAQNLHKRAEGELNRLLAIFPSNGEAREMLSRLGK